MFRHSNLLQARAVRARALQPTDNDDGGTGWREIVRPQPHEVQHTRRRDGDGRIRATPCQDTKANSSISPMRPPYYPFLEDRAILEVIENTPDGGMGMDTFERRPAKGH